MRNIALKLIQITFLLLVGNQVFAQEENRLYLPDITGMESSTISLPVYLDNTSIDITGLQFDITVPKEVLTITIGATTLSDRKVDHEVIVSAIGGNSGTYRVMVYSPSNTPLTANSGEVLTLSVKVANVVDKEKTYPLQLSRASIGDRQGNNVLTGTADGTFRCLSCPDFTVSDIRWTTSNVAPGDTLELSWKVSNVGGAPSTGGWSERITLVDASGAERFLGTCYNSEATLAMGAIASRSAKVTIPLLPGLEGNTDIKIEVVPNSDSGEGAAYRANNTLQTTSHDILLSKCLSLTLPKASVIEGEDATLHCKISRSGHTDTQQTVTLTKLSGDNRLTMPNSVVIPQGQSTAWFDIAINDNDAFDEDSLFIIQAAVNGYDAVQQTLQVDDNKLRQLTLTATPSALNEGDTFTLTVKTEKAMPQPITVKLTAEHPERLLMAETVTIAANATTAETVVAVVDNEVIDLSTSLAIKGIADNHQPGECLIIVEDNDMPAIDLELSASTVSENAISPAAVATLRRTTHTDRETTILISTSSDNIVLSTNKITMKEGETEKLFSINVKDNDQVDGTRQAAITAAVRVASCNCSADTTTVGSVTKTLEITDNEGASLNVTSSRASIVKGSGKTVTLTISRNTSTKKTLTVTLSSDNDAVVTYPHSVTIPANAASAEVTVTATEDATTDAKTVAFTAEAINHAKGSCWLTLADTPYPIAVVKNVSFSSTEVTGGGEVEVTLTVANVGTAELPENTKIEYYIDGKKQPYSILTDQAIAPGGEITITETIFLPEAVGSYEITFKVEDNEGTGDSATWTIGNSLSEPVTLSTTSSFTATITSDKQVYKQEEVVTLNGQLQGEKIAYTDVQITLHNDGARQLLAATTDGEGRFSTTYQLRSLQTGHFAVSAGSPGENVTEEMAGFDVYGLTAEAPKNVELVLPETYAGSIKISNPGNKAQTNVRVEMLSESNTCDFSFNTLGSIAAGATVNLPFTITSKALTDGNGWQKMSIAIVTDEGAIVRRTIQYFVQCKTGKLKPSTAYIDATMNIHTAKEYPVVVRNIGKGETGKITLALPSWITTATPREMASLAPGDSVTILLKFNPTSEMQLNVAVTGNIGLQCANGEGATIAFSVTPVSDEKGTMTLDVVDEFTFHTEEGPHVADATVKVFLPGTKQIVTEGKTNNNGLFSTQLNEGWYDIKVEAEYHDSKTFTFTVNPGRERKKQVYISYQNITYSFEVDEIEIEDGYKVDLNVDFESSAPIPTVDISMPRQIYRAGDLFAITVTNSGFFSVYDVEVSVSPPNGLKFIFLDEPTLDVMEGKTKKEFYVKVVTDDGNGSEHAPQNPTKAPSSQQGCQQVEAKIKYYCIVCDEKEEHLKKVKYSINCDGHSSSGSGSGGGGGGYGGGSSIDSGDSSNSDTTTKECELDTKFVFKLVETKTGQEQERKGVAADGVSQVKIVLDKANSTLPKKISEYSFEWVLSTSETLSDKTIITNNSQIKYGTFPSHYTALENYTFTAPENFPELPGGLNLPKEQRKKECTIYAILKYKKKSDAEWKMEKVDIVISRVPVVFVHGLNSSADCWSDMIPFLIDSLFYDDSQLFVLDYKKTHNKSFETNKDIVYNNVNNCFVYCKGELKIETNKVDLVTHSMGGLLTKQDIIGHKDFKQMIHKFITINTPHGGSQLGNFMTDTRVINDKHSPRALYIFSVWEILYGMFSPDETPMYEYIIPFLNIDRTKMLTGAVYDLAVNDPENNYNKDPEDEKKNVPEEKKKRRTKYAIDNLNTNISGIKCHAIATNSNGCTSKWDESLAFHNLSDYFGYTKVEKHGPYYNMFHDLFKDDNDCIVGYTSQKGGLDGNYLSGFMDRNTGMMAHTSTCHEKDIKVCVLRLLIASLNSGLFSNEFKQVKNLKYNPVKLKEKYEESENDNTSSQSLKASAKAHTASDTFKLTYSYNPGDTLISIHVAHPDDMNVMIRCVTKDQYLSFIDGDEGTIIIPNKILGNVFVTYYGYNDDDYLTYATDTIPVNTIGSATIDHLEFSSDSLLIINNEYVSPSVSCVWSDGDVTELNDAVLSVLDGRIARVEENQWVYGNKTGRTYLRANYQGHTCDIPLYVYVYSEEGVVEEEFEPDDDANRNQVCNVITLAVSQETVMTRQAFRATFTLNNGHKTSSLENFQLNLSFHDAEGGLMTSHEFQVNLDSIAGFQGEKQLGTSWTLQPNESGKAIMTLIPTKYAAPSTPMTYSIGGSFSYTDPYSGILVTREIAPVNIVVNPSPDLDLTYFLQRDILGDDPLTDDVVEESVPAEMALIIHNKGYGEAKNLKWMTVAPQIVENEKGLVVDFDLMSSQLNGEDATLALGGTVVTDFGSIPAHSKTYAQWWLESTLLGHFIEYDVEATHVTSYDNEDLSLLGDVTIHELAHGFTPDPLAETPVRAFLVNDIPDNADTPDMLYFTDDREEETVSVASDVVMTRITNTEYEVTVTPSARGWTYGKVSDLTAGRQQIVNIVRKSDGLELPVDNFWQTDRTLRDGKKPRYENMLHLVVETDVEETYILSFSPKPAMELEVVSIAGPPPEGEVLTSQLSSVVVTFNKAIDATTFSTDDLTLNCQGKLIDLTPVSIVQNSETEYLIQFGEATLEGGFYVFTVKTENITDTEGFTGNEGKMASWTQYPDGKVTLTVKASPAEGGTVMPSNGKVGRDSEVTLKAVPSAGFMFYRWLHYDDPLEETESFNYTLTRDEEFTAEFIPIIFEEPENDADREAYAVLSPDSTTLTFYYDGKKATRQGTVYEMNTGTELPRWYPARASIQHVAFMPSFAAARPVSTYMWFYNMGALSQIEGLHYLNTSNVTNMYAMFNSCSSLTSLDVSHFDTSNVTDMRYMFYGCSSLTSLDVSHFDTSKVTNMIYMFGGCSNLTSLDVSHFDTSKVTDMDYMFNGCSNLTSLDVSHFDTSNVTNMGYMFSGCSSLTSLDVSHFDMTNVTETLYMLWGCSSLEELSVSSTMENINATCCTGIGTASTPCFIIAPDDFDFGVDTSGDYFRWKSGYFKFVEGEPYTVLSPDSTMLTFYYDDMKATRAGTTYEMNTGSSYPGWYGAAKSVQRVVFNPTFSLARPVSTASWFSQMESITEIEGLQYLNTSEVTEMDYMFYQCKSLTSLDVSLFDTSNATKMDGMFSSCISLNNLDVTHFDTSKVTRMQFMFNNCTALTSLDVSHFNTSEVTLMLQMFGGCENLTNLDVSHFDTSKVTDMSWMFYNCANLTSLDVSHFDTSNVTNFEGMFSHCINLPFLDVSHFDTSSATNMMTMFQCCSNLTSLDVSHFDTSNVTTMYFMFNQCSSLTSIDVSHFNTSNVTNMGCMFNMCTNLTSLDLSSFDTSNATNMEQMFNKCSSLTSLDISNFDTSKLVNLQSMFSGCYNLRKIDLSHFNISNDANSSGMLASCTSLEELSVSSSMENIYDNACYRVGTASNPCTIYAPAGFNFGVDTSVDYFIWKRGYFKLGSAFLLGDVNHDGAVNITDVMSVVNYIMGATPAVFFMENADMNGDGSINITDVTVIVNLILHGSAAMVPEHVREQMMDELVVASDADGYVISLKNHEPYTALQMDVALPEGTELVTALLDISRSDNHKVFCERVSSNRYRVVVYSQAGSEIRGSEGDLLQLVTRGSRRGSVAVEDVMLTNKQLETVVIPEASIVTGVGSPAIEDHSSPSFTIQGIPAEKHKRGVVVKKGNKRAVK